MSFETTQRALHPINVATEVLGIGRTKLFEEIAAGRLRTVTVGRRRLVPQSAIEEYVRLLEAEAAGAQ